MLTPSPVQSSHSETMDAARPSACVFRIEDLTWKYGKSTAIDRLTVEIPTGTTAVLGMSGSGKTTLLNLLGLLMEPSLLDWARGRGLQSKNIVYHSPQGWELDYQKLLFPARNRLRLYHFGFVLQSAYLLPNFSCSYNIQLPMRLQNRGRRELEDRLRRLIQEVDPRGTDLEPHLKKFPNSVSGGERQRMAVLRAIIHEPDVIFADEPSASLDPINTHRVATLLKNWQRGMLAGTEGTENRRTLLYVSHDTEAAVRIADQFLLMRKGRLVENQLLTKTHLADDPQMSDDELIQCCVWKIKKLIDPEQSCTLRDLRWKIS